MRRLKAKVERGLWRSPGLGGILKDGIPVQEGAMAGGLDERGVVRQVVIGGLVTLGVGLVGGMVWAGEWFVDRLPWPVLAVAAVAIGVGAARISSRRPPSGGLGPDGPS